MNETQASLIVTRGASCVCVALRKDLNSFYCHVEPFWQSLSVTEAGYDPSAVQPPNPSSLSSLN